MVDVTGPIEGSPDGIDVVDAWVEGILFPEHSDRPEETLAFGRDSGGKPGMYEEKDGVWYLHHSCGAEEIKLLGYLNDIVRLVFRSTPGPRVVIGWSRIEVIMHLDTGTAPKPEWESEIS